MSNTKGFQKRKIDKKSTSLSADCNATKNQFRYQTTNQKRTDVVILLHIDSCIVRTNTHFYEARSNNVRTTFEQNPKKKETYPSNTVNTIQNTSKHVKTRQNYSVNIILCNQIIQSNSNYNHKII